MKNFTNNFKQFTLRLSARWLIMVLMLLVGTSSVWADKVFYLDLSGFASWKDSNAKFSVNYFGGGVTQSFTDFATSVTINGKSYYKATGIPDAATTIIWVRHNSSASKPDWNNKWNQTGDLTISSANGKNVVKITGWDAGSWSETVSECKTTTLTWNNDSSIKTSMKKGDTQTVSVTLSPSGAGTPTFTTSSSSVISLSGSGSSRTLTAEAAGSAIITASFAEANGYCGSSIRKTITVTDPCSPKYYIAGTLPGASWDASKHLEMTCVDGLRSYTFTDAGKGEYKFKITNNTWGSSWNTLNTSKSSGVTCKDNDGDGNMVFETPAEGNITIYFDDALKAWVTWEANCSTPKTPSIASSHSSICNGNNTPVTITVTGEAETFKLYTVTNNGNLLKETKNTKTFTVEPTQTTTYVVKAFNGTCASDNYSDEVTVEVSTKPNITLTEESTAICKGDELDLSPFASSTVDLTWWNGQTQITELVSPETNTTYTVKAVNGACTVSEDFTVTVNALPGAPTDLGSATICNGDPATLPDVTGSWYANANTATPLASISLEVNPAETTSYFATSKSNNCESSTRTEYVVTVKPKVDIAWNQAPENMLVNNTQNVSTTLTGTGNVVYTSSDNTIIKVEDNKLTALKTGTAIITATATGTDDYCGTAIVTKDITVTCVNVNEPNISAPSSICEGNTVTLTLRDRQEGVTYTVNGEVAFNAGNEYTSNQTEFTIVASHLNQCSSATTTKTVNVDRISAISLKGAPTICNGDQITLEEYVDSNTGTVTWYTNPERTQVAEDKVSPSETTTYYAKAVSGECSAATAELLVTVKQIPTSSDFTYSIPDESVVYDGNAHSIEVTWNNAGGSTGITVLYNGSETAPTTPGTYTVSVTTAEKGNYCATISAVELGEFTIVCPKPNAPQILSSQNTITCNGTTEQQGKIKIDYNSNYTYEINNNVVDNIVDGFIDIETYGEELSIYAINECGTSSDATTFTINSIENAPVITGNNSFQPGGNTVLTSDKGANTIWKASGGKLSAESGASVTFSADANGKYTITAIYNGCETEFVVSVQDDIYVWMRKPNKKENAYTNFYYINENPTQGGMMYYKEFTSKPTTVPECNQGGRERDKECTDKEGYTWYGYVISKEAIENEYYFTVHAANPGGKNGVYTHTLPYKLQNVTSDLYFVMDESGSLEGWYINAPVVVRASGDAKFNANNFADFVPLYVKDANICGKEVVSFEWQKSDSENGTYNTYKSGKGINNIRTREAGWYRCVVTYGDGQGTATSNAIEVTNTTSDTPGTLADFSSKLPVIMVNTNGVGFPSDKNLATKNTNCASGKRYPSLYADDLKEKVTVDVIIKKGNEILYDRKARMNYRGSSSLNFKKKSYAFCSAQDSCVFDKGRHDYVKTKKEKMLNLLGDENYKTSDKDWVLYAATPDPSMMRNRLVFDLYQQMRPNEWGVHSTYVELIVDGEYRGVYVFMDKITANEGRVNITNSDGFIVKFDKTDVVDRVEDKDGDQKTFATTRTGTKENSNGIESYGACIDQRFEIEYPEKEDIEDAGGSWEAFYKKVQQRFEDFETALANKQYDKVRDIIDYDSWADWFILSEFIKNQDGFRASNIFIYNGGKIMATPLWDQELSLDNRTRIAHGSNSENGLLSTTNSVYKDAFPAPFWFTNEGTDVNNLTGGLLNDPCFVALVKSKWDDYQADVLSASNCSTLVAKYHGELDDDIRSREENKWPYTEAARGKTTDGDYMGYYAEGDPDHYSYNASKNAITNYAAKRSTELKDNVGGLGEAIYDLNGETLIFNIKPNIVETSPWQQSIVTVNAPEGYEYVLDYSKLPVGAEVKENGNAYTIKIPRPSDWEISGNGDAKKKTYTITATIDAEGENSCGAKIENTANATINVNDVTEDCETPIVKP